ncbi:MAG: hypothetical protein E7524_01830 [Ruminococcaceae bacterium]|nr:hypothetical protein [Oscillospiraceae bacterium]
MALHIKTGLTAPEGFINDVYEIDKITYSPELCGQLENLTKRYNRCKDSFILLYDDKRLAGYMNFFPVGKTLYKEMTDRDDHRMRDDDISPEEIEDWSCEKENNIFIISIALHPDYRKKNSNSNNAIVMLTDAFLELLRQKDNSGFKITSISGYAVSLGGVKCLKRMYASLLKDTDEDYHFFFTNKKNVARLLEEGYAISDYKKNYNDDIYFFLPMTSDGSDGSFNTIVDAEKRLHNDDEDFDYVPTEDLSKLPFGELYCKVLNRHVEYECNSEAFKGKNMRRIYLGEFSLALYDDDYDDIPLDDITAHLFATVHKSTGIYIITVAVPNNKHNPSQLIDQMSTGHLDIKNEKGEYVKIVDYFKENYKLLACGEAKCVICMSEMPQNPLELPYILSGETMISKHVNYKIRPEHREKLTACRAIYDYYDSYISRSVIAFVFKDYSKAIDERMSDEASELFIVEIVLFQNTAVLRTNQKVVKELEDNKDISIADIDELYIEFGKTVQFWNSDIFKYPFSQIEADEVIKSFGIKETLDDYHRNQQFLDRLIELKNNITEQKSDKSMNNILFFLSCVEGSSVTLGAVLWIWHLIKNADSLTLNGDLFIRFGWVFIFIVCALAANKLANLYYTKKLFSKKHKQNKIKFNKK